MQQPANNKNTIFLIMLQKNKIQQGRHWQQCGPGEGPKCQRVLFTEVHTRILA